MLRFKPEVRLNADASPTEIASRLSGLVAPPFSFSKSLRKKLLRGRISAQGGSLRWPMTQGRFASARNLVFALVETPTGCVLQGSFRIGKQLAICSLIWISFVTLFGSWELLQLLLHRGPVREILLTVARILAAYGGAIAYVGLVVLVGRPRDCALVRVLRVALASQTAADAVDHIFAPDEGANESFVDGPSSAAF
jgi:hypothetical protein